MSGTGGFIFLTPPSAAHGFALPGFRQREVAVQEAEPELLTILREAAAHLVVVDERLLAGIDEERFREMGKRYAGAIVVLPAPGKDEGPGDYAQRLIARAVGYQMRIIGTTGH